MPPSKNGDSMNDWQFVHLLDCCRSIQYVPTDYPHFLQIGDYMSDFMMAEKLAFVTTKRIKDVRTAL